MDIVQVRGKDLPAADLEKLVEVWIDTVAAHDTLVVVNDRLDVTLATGADGVHVGQDDLSPEEVRELAPADLVIGRSAHDRREVLLAQESGATYAGLGAFYGSRTKPEASVLEPGKAGLREPIPALTIPVVAIGGITVERVREVLSLPPVTGIAVSEAIQGADDPARAVTRLRSALDRAWLDRSLLVALSAIVLFGAEACGGREGAAPEAAGPEAAGTTDVRPLIDPASVTVREIFQLPDAAASSAGLRQPRDLSLDAGGTLYVLDFAAPDHRQIVAFDPSGVFAYRFGELDDRADRVGPAGQFAVTPWKYVMQVDAADNSLTSFLTLGTYVSTATLTGVGMAVHPIQEYGHYYLKKWDPPRRRAYVLHMQLPVDSVSMVYEVSLPPGQSVKKDARDVSFLTASDGLGCLYVAFSDVYRVRVLDRDGATVRVVQSSRPAVPKSPREMEEERKRLVARLESQVGDVSDSLLQEASRPDSLFPLVDELSVDPAGRLWVRTHRPEISAGSVYDVFNERGELISWVAIPAAVRKTAFAPDGRLYVIDEREPKRPRIVAYEVGFGGGPEVAADTTGG